MGRMGGVGSSAGTYDLVLATADAFDGGDNNVFGFATSDRYDNMVTYQTPKFAGLQATVQYSFNEDSVKETAREGSSAVNRYSSAALTGDFGALRRSSPTNSRTTSPSALMNMTTARSSTSAATTTAASPRPSSWASTSRASRPVSSPPLLKPMPISSTRLVIRNPLPTASKGYGVHLGTIVPVAGGDLTVAAYFTDFTVEFDNGEDGDAKTTPSVPSTSTTSPSALPSTRVPASLRSSMTMKAPTRRPRPTSV